MGSPGGKGDADLPLLMAALISALCHKQNLPLCIFQNLQLLVKKQLVEAQVAWRALKAADYLTSYQPQFEEGLQQRFLNGKH